ncbi:hypothetical protein RESH_05741 [Rhodopirellula europaea SH398]|uniref:Uncharacterized protein n=1 Tax=Rhodopirellula europaea SH398 TaxID=1263868 RepID=M5RWJ5_9BACT|nr:hypothetical protein RESH_05741 [Rhodopirellula europaea SH398]
MNRSPFCEFALAAKAQGRCYRLACSDLTAFRVVQRTAVTPRRDGL